MGLFSKQSSTSNQTSNYNDSSANAGGDDSVALATGSKLDVSNRSTNQDAISGQGGLSLSNAELTLNTLSDGGAIDLAKALSLKSVELAGKQTEDLKGYVQSNQNFARSVAETALATASGQPIPATSNKLFYVLGGVLALVVLLLFGRKSKP
jgi:hypothetical protein